MAHLGWGRMACSLATTKEQAMRGPPHYAVPKEESDWSWARHGRSFLMRRASEMTWARLQPKQKLYNVLPMWRMAKARGILVARLKAKEKWDHMSDRLIAWLMKYIGMNMAYDWELSGSLRTAEGWWGFGVISKHIIDCTVLCFIVNALLFKFIATVNMYCFVKFIFVATLV